jgi:hypothetical protein
MDLLNLTQLEKVDPGKILTMDLEVRSDSSHTYSDRFHIWITYYSGERASNIIIEISDRSSGVHYRNSGDDFDGPFDLEMVGQAINDVANDALSAEDSMKPELVPVFRKEAAKHFIEKLPLGENAAAALTTWLDQNPPTVS